MRTAIAAHELLPKGLELESLSIETRRVTIYMGSRCIRPRCPACGLGSSWVYGFYPRTVSDLP